MNKHFSTRRRLLWSITSVTLGCSDRATSESGVTLYTFGDSILDCGAYNAYSVHPGQLLVRNNDKLFPEFRGKDLQSRGSARLQHRAVDGATVDGLVQQARGIAPDEAGLALVTVGGNDLLRGLVADRGDGIKRFETTFRQFLEGLAIRRITLGNVYDPTFGDDSRNFLNVEPRLARSNHRRVNDVIGSLAARYGRLADIHAHFLKGDPSWFTNTIEPSLIGASEVRRAFLFAIE